MVKVTTKKTEYVKLILIPILYKNKVEEYLDKTLPSEKQFISYRILIEKIKGPYLLRNDSKGCIYKITGHTGTQFYAVQYHSLVLNELHTNTLCKIYQYENKKKEDSNAKVEKCSDDKINSLFKCIGERTLCGPFCHLNGPYQKIFDIFRDLPMEKLKLSLELKADLIVELMKIFQNNKVSIKTNILDEFLKNESIDSDDEQVLNEFIKNYGKLYSNAGISRFDEKLNMKENWSIVYRSVTGFYESAISINALFKRK